jgi:hypothetical protein
MKQDSKKGTDRSTLEGGRNEDRGSMDAQRALGRKPEGRGTARTTKRTMKR